MGNRSGNKARLLEIEGPLTATAPFYEVQEPQITLNLGSYEHVVTDIGWAV